MKITTKRLKQIIKEELEKDLGESKPVGSREMDSTRMAAGLPVYKEVSQELLDLASKIETGEVADMDAFLSEFMAIQKILDAHGRAVPDTSGQVHEASDQRFNADVEAKKLRVHARTVKNPKRRAGIERLAQDIEDGTVSSWPQYFAAMQIHKRPEKA